MEAKKKIIQLDDVKILVDSFYGKVRKDGLLASIFNQSIADKWPEHLEKMYSFWQTVLLGEHSYYGSPIAPHANLPVDKNHFKRWLKLFNETIDENFSGEIAEEARWRATKMAEMFHYKIEYYRDNQSKPVL
jgi:hemoglobin